MNTVSRRVIRRVRVLRKWRGLSQQGLADVCGCWNGVEVTRDWIAHAETGGRATVSVDHLVILASALGVDPGDLLGLESVSIRQTVL